MSTIQTVHTLTNKVASSLIFNGMTISLMRVHSSARNADIQALRDILAFELREERRLLGR